MTLNGAWLGHNGYGDLSRRGVTDIGFELRGALHPVTRDFYDMLVKADQIYPVAQHCKA